MGFWTAVISFFTAVGNFIGSKAFQTALTAVTLAVGVKGFMQARQMLAKGQDIMANKTSAGGKIPVIYGTRRVGAQVIYMDVSDNDSRDLYVVYALSVGECEEIIGRSIELDGNALTDSARFRDGGYIGSDKISSGSGSLNTVTQNGTGINAGAGGFGTDPTARYRYVFNLHHGAASQTADPMLVASMPNWTSLHRLDGVCYIAAHYGYDKEGMWRGVPQLTVQVRGKKVFDPRDSNQTFGTVSTYEHSDNPALCFLDYITDNEVGKGLTESQINMSTFSSAANVCDTQVDQPYFNGTAQSVTWNGNSGDSFINITGTGANTVWWQNKIGELMDLQDGSSNVVLDGAQITEVKRDEFYDVNAAYAVYFNSTLGSTYSSENGTSLLKVKRFHCNGYVDTNKNVMDNAKELLANMRGIFLYINGKYELSIEDTGSSTFSITDNHIISDSGISVDYGNKDKKANKVIVEFFNANKKYELDTATVLHDASPNYTSDDGGEVLEVKAEFPYVSDPYIAYNMAKAILTRSRNQTTMQFVGTPEMYKLNVGDIVDLTYAGLGFNGKICRVEALELQSNGLVAVSLIEYFDVYTWEVPPQEPLEELANLPSAYAVKAPTGLSFTDSDSSSTGRPFLSWNEPTDFPDYQYRVNVVDSSNNQVINKIVDVENCDLNFVKTGSNYVASVSSLNTLGVESSAATLTFTVGVKPVNAGVDVVDGTVATLQLADDAVTLAKAAADLIAAIDAGGAGLTELIKATSAPSTRTDGSALQAQDLWADTNDNNQIYVRNAANSGWEKARDSSLVTLYNSLSSTVSTNSTNISTAQSDIVTLTTDTSANASAITSLTSTVGTNTSAISTEATTRANADTALAADITSLTSTVSGNTSSISSEATTRANADTALAADITSLTSTVSGNTSSISSEATTRANADTALAADITSLTSTVNSNTSSVSSEAITRANADSALAADITSLTSTVNGNTSSISSEAVTRSNADSALAADISTVTSTVNGVSSSVTTNTAAISTIDGNASAGFVLKTNAAGKVAQMVLGSNASSGSGATSTIAFLADTFKIDNNAGSSVSPFIVSGGSVFIDNARITNLSGTKIDVDTLNVKQFANTSSKIISHLTAGTKFDLGRDGQAYVQRTGTYTGSNASFVPVTITNVRNNAGYVAIFSGVLGDVSGGRVQYSLNNSTWVNANGNTNISWSAGTYRGYTYVYTGQITTLSTSQSTVYWRVYFSGGYNHTQLSLNIMMDNTR